MQNKQRNPLIRLIKDSKRHWPGMIWLILLMFASGVLKSYGAEAFGKMVDHGAALDFSQATLFGLIAIGFYAADAVRLALFNSESPRIVDMMFLDIRMNMFRAIARGKMSSVEKSAKQGDILSRTTQDLSALHRLFAERACWLISVLGRGVIALIFCVNISWELALVYIILLPLAILLMDKMGKPLQAYQKQASKSGGSATSILTEIMNNIQVIKSFNAESEMKKRFNGTIDEQSARLYESERRSMALVLTGYVADILQLALIFLLGVYLVYTGQVSIGALVAFIALTSSIREMFELAHRFVVSVRTATALSERVYEVLDLPPESGDEARGLLSIPEPENDIEMRNLRFAYDEHAPLLRGITLRIARGQRIAFVGPSGCGKSTLVKLICLFYRNYEGEFTLFGHSAKDAPENWVRDRIAMVSQQPYLFRGSIADNIRYGKPEATEAEIEKALKDVQLWDFVTSLKEGMHTDIGDYGARLSGGQRQRIAIARALIRDAKLILLDEATSALDMHTEEDILSTLDDLFKNKTVITIAHRFAAVRAADYVYCIEDGVISEEGTIERLLAENGYLSRIAKAQEGR